MLQFQIILKSSIKDILKNYIKFQSGKLPSLISNEYLINNKQNSAFQIVANHIVFNEQKQLKMHINRINGIDKSQINLIVFLLLLQLEVQ